MSLSVTISFAMRRVGRRKEAILLATVTTSHQSTLDASTIATVVGSAVLSRSNLLALFWTMRSRLTSEYATSSSI